MSVLPDHKISYELSYGNLSVEPVNISEQLQPASLDVRLGNEFKEFPRDQIDGSDIISSETNVTDSMVETKISDSSSIIIYPGDFYLANTKEKFSFPEDILGRLTGRSSLGRMGITIHQTAGLFDPGFEGEGVFELTNVSNKPVKLQPGMKVAQMVFERLEERCNSPYSEETNHYQHQEGAVPSKIE